MQLVHLKSPLELRLRLIDAARAVEGDGVIVHDRRDVYVGVAIGRAVDAQGALVARERFGLLAQLVVNAAEVVGDGGDARVALAVERDAQRHRALQDVLGLGELRALLEVASRVFENADGRPRRGAERFGVPRRR